MASLGLLIDLGWYTMLNDKIHDYLNIFKHKNIDIWLP